MNPTDDPTNCRIMVVDDLTANRELLSDFIEMMDHQSITASSGKEALELLSPEIDLVLLDVMMPEMNGFAVTKAIRQHPICGNVPVVLCTALDSRTERLNGVMAGANDFIGKPIDRTELRIRVNTVLKGKIAQDELLKYQSELESIVKARTREVVAALEEVTMAHLDTVHRLALAAEFRDEQTAEHLERVGQYCALLARAYGLPEQDVDRIYFASTMHDVGKIALPDAILRKPGLLDDHERRTMQEHARNGAQILSGSQSPLIHEGEIIAFSHHERWDGSGYPLGLAGENIPLSGRICAIADVFDALTSERSYKMAYSIEKTKGIMAQGRGTHFDPNLLDLFFEHFEGFVRIYENNKQKSVFEAPALDKAA